MKLLLALLLAASSFTVPTPGSDLCKAILDGLRVDAVLRKRGGRWLVVEHAIGATDVWYCDVGPRSLKAGWGC